MIRSGEIVTVRKTAVFLLRKGDLILFKTHQHSLRLHRIINIARNPDGKLRIQTKGDSVSYCDAPIGESQVMGKAIWIEKKYSCCGIHAINTERTVWKMVNFCIARIPDIRNSVFAPFIRPCYRGIKFILSR